MPQTDLIQKVVRRVMAPVLDKRAKAIDQGEQTKALFQEVMLAGYPYHRAEGVWPFLRIGEVVRLQREPYNQHDHNAIAVYFKNDMLGYIPRNENRLLAQMMDRGERLEVRITQLLPESRPWKGMKLSVFLGTKRYKVGT